MLELPGVTLVCIDCVHHELALAAIEQTLVRCRFADALFITDRSLPIPPLRVIEVPRIEAHPDYSRFVARELVRHVTTPHALLIQWDAFVVNPAAWGDAFLACDYIAALPGSEQRPLRSAGIALISRRLLAALGDARIADVDDLDRAIHQTYRTHLERDFGIRFPTPAISEQFAFGDGYPVGQPFGFQRLFNMWMFFQPQDLRAFLAMASPAILGSPDAVSLAINLRDLERDDEARMVLRAIIAAYPDNGAARAELRAIERGAQAAAQPARAGVGRNDPCPCGSGQKFKQCHGRLSGAPATMPVRDTPASASDESIAQGSLTVLLHRARAAFERRELAIAERLYRKILERFPNNPVATGFLGVIATRMRHYDIAEPLLLRAIDIAPAAPEYHNNLGLLQQSRGEFGEAAATYRRALAVAPDYAAAHNNLGLALQELGEVAAAIQSFRAAVRSLPEFAEAHWNLALALLLAGELEEGFAEQEWRLRAAQHRNWWAQRRQFPEWRGEPLIGKRFLILAEQGMGDMIQFVRYAAELAARGATVHVEAPPELADLFRAVPGVTAVVPCDGPYPACDYQAPMLSLPQRCGTRLDTIPSPPRYIVTDASRRVRWREALGPNTRPRVGVAWAGNPDHVRDAMRSLPLAALSPLLALSGIEWIGLQKGAAAAEMAALPPRLALRDMAAIANDFADTAALIAELDLVIAVDTSVVHLAGALGAPTWLLLDAANDWRWLERHADSPWYPSVRLLRQAQRGDWGSVVEAAVADLRSRFSL